MAHIIYTLTDEAPALATRSLLPIVCAFARTAGIEIETKDISLAARILANFNDLLPEGQRTPDALAELGALAQSAEANIIKLPNISASIPQLTAAVGELVAAGFDLPDFPAEPESTEEQDIRARYGRALGSAVNPVLREGNSDRRVAEPVKEYARKNPHSMGQWVSDSKSHVASMSEGDFFGSEQSHVIREAGIVSIRLIDQQGQESVLKDSVPVQEGEVIDAAVMGRRALRSFLEREIQDAKDAGVLFSVHLKATMMKVSDPIIFGHVVSVFFAEVFEEFQQIFDELGVDPNNGLGDVFAKIERLPSSQQDCIRQKISSTYENRPALAMVDSDRGITNLHVPSDVIIDASMPAAIRSSGKMWGPDGQLHDIKAVIPDRSYAGVYSAVIDFCKQHGAFDVTTMGSVSNVGLMAQKAEEYGSHDKTFEIPHDGVVRVCDAAGVVLMEHAVEAGDIWRMCQTKDAPIRDWVNLAVRRARATGTPAVFWLDPQRAHDANLIEKVNAYLTENPMEGLDIQIMSPVDAATHACQRARNGQDTISVTGNVLRDYLTDLFPILELGTSAKMLSIVPLLAGGGLFETGAGGSAPKHVQQFLEEGHLRWDSLGEYLALAVSLEDFGNKSGNQRAIVLAKALNEATGKILDENKSPSRKVYELDNRGGHFYLAMYWAQSLAAQREDVELSETFQAIAESLSRGEQEIIGELSAAQGHAVDIGGYYRPDESKVAMAMRPSVTFNAIVDQLSP